jgi:predicted NUDIX family phosphoesterase
LFRLFFCEPFAESGVFLARDEVEKDLNLLQALPVAVIRNKTGDVLLLKRRERSDSNPLHEKLVLWAGGHVRREDATNGDPVITSLTRELHEELRLDVDKASLRFLGAVYIDNGEATCKHVALVFEWRASTDDVAVCLSTAEFFERRGTSLSGKFVSVEHIIRDVNAGKLTEPWSSEIARHLLDETAGKIGDQLF